MEKVTGKIEVEWGIHKSLCNSFFDTILFSIFDFQRGPLNWQDNFFLRVSDEFVETLSAIEILMKKGYRNQCRRECRFVLELAIKAAVINQKNSSLKFDDQLIAFQKLIKNSGINSINQLSFPLFKDEIVKKEFVREVKKTYGMLCTYVHVTPEQFTEKLILKKTKDVSSDLSLEELELLNAEIGQVFSYIIVLLFNSLPEFIVNDFMEPRRSDYYYNKSRYVAIIDELFDYKHERKAFLEKIKLTRKTDVEF